MFSDRIGTPATLAGREALLVAEGDRGHAVYGPYEHVRPGVFRVDYDLALAGSPAPGGDPVVARIDVTAYDGRVGLAARELRASELGRDPRTFSLTFTLREFRSLEYRVDAAGAAAFLVGNPRLVRFGPVTDEAPPADPLEETPDPIEKHRQMRAVLSLLRPQRAVGFRKIRLGHPGDGGYVCIDDFAGLDTALSFGINDDISWDLDAAARGMTIHQFDHTVDDPAPDDGRMIFSKKMIAPAADANSVTLSDLIRSHDKGRDRPNMMLKMDIEGWEWPVRGATPAEELSRFSQIVCELHYFQGLAEPDYRRKIYEGLRRLHESYAVVHVHANIVGGISNVGNVIFPNVLEATFANRALYDLEDTDELFPSPLDICCDPNQADMFLGSFRF